VSTLAAEHVVPDWRAAIEEYYVRGWTDGLPVVPPTPERVVRMLEAAQLQPSHEITYVAHRADDVTQAVFVALARDARKVRRGERLSKLVLGRRRLRRRHLLRRR